MIPKFIDTHAHVQFNAFRKDGHEVVRLTINAGGWLVIPGSQIDTSRRAVEYAEKYQEGVYAAVGLHPMHLEESRVDMSELGGGEDGFNTRCEEYDREQYEKLLSSPKVVAIGEIGLDYWRKPKTKARREAYKAKQLAAFRAQLDLACDHDLPVILHCRVAFNDMLEVVKDHPITKKLSPPGVAHSFTGDTDALKEFLDLGYYIAYNALIFKLPHLQGAVRETPLNRIVLETDAPYLTPPSLGEIRNEPKNVLITAHRIAELKGVPYDEVLEQTTKNAQKLFRL